MKTKAKSDNVYVLRIWSKKYYAAKGRNVNCKSCRKVMYRGQVRSLKSNKNIMFNSPAGMLKAMEDLYKLDEKLKI